MKILKKLISSMLILAMLLSNSQSLVAYASEEVSKSGVEKKQDNISEKTVDITPPVIDVSSLRVDKKEVKPGDSVNISLKATDDMSGIKYMWVDYKTPITGKTKDINLYYNEITDRYECNIDIDENKESGLWQISRIFASDNLGNYINIYNFNIHNFGDKDLSGGDFNVIGTDVDITPPMIDISSLTVDKKEAKPGDSVNISLKATDDMSGIKYMWVDYKTPITGKTKDINLYYNETTDRYECNIDIDENKESGLWQISRIFASDNLGNYINIYNFNIHNFGDKDLSGGDFNVIGTDVDITPPVIDISSLKVDKKEAKPGDSVNISLKATDDMSGIKYMWVDYKTPITGKTKDINLYYNETTDRYECNIDIDENKESGLWQISRIFASDNLGNYINIYNFNIHNFGDADLSAGDFNVQNDDSTISPIEGSTVVTKNESWSNKTINGDLYIGPNAVLTINSNVTVTGNVYVLGALKTYGGLTINGTLYGNRMLWGGATTLYNGTIVVYGSNSIYSATMTSYPVENIPLRIDTEPLVANNGKLNIKGATLDIADMYIEGNLIELDYKGRFDVSDLNIGNKDSIKIEFKTVFGNTITKEIQLDNHINKIPEIIAEDISIKVGDKFNLLENVKAIDKEDGDITSKIEVVENTVDTTKAGKYKVVYSVEDSDGNIVTKEILVTVNLKLSILNSIPTITAKDVSLKVGDKFDVMSGVSASDKEDGDITSKIEVIENTVDATKVGEYKVVYKVTDSQGASSKKTIKVVVRSNEKSVITAEDSTLKVGDKFDVMSGVSASDKEDGDITSKIKVIENTVDTQNPGKYKVVYSVEDSDGNIVTKEIVVTVNPKLSTINNAPIIKANDITLKVGDKFDVMSGVSASDKEDGDIKSKIVVIENTVNTTKVGEYKIVYKVTDSQGASSKKTIKVVVRSNEKPVITVKDVVLTVGDKFDVMSEVSASDKEDGNITSNIKVVENTVNILKAGKYKVVYSVTDNDGNIVKIERIITVNTLKIENVKATSTSYNSNKITWGKVSKANGYEVWKSTSKNGTYKSIKTITNGNTVSYTNTSLATGTTYYYKVRAYRTVNGKKVYSNYSGVVSAKPILSSTTAKATSASYNSNKITWNKVSGANGYEVYRSTSKNGTYKSIKTITSGSTLSYTNTSLATGTTYYYKVSAYRTVNGKKVYSNYSVVVSSKPALSNPSVTLTAGIKKVTVKWKKISGTSGYEVYRSTSKNGKYTNVKTITKGSTVSFTNSSLTKNKTYYYKVRAYRLVNGKKVYSSYSSIKSVKAK